MLVRFLNSQAFVLVLVLLRARVRVCMCFSCGGVVHYISLVSLSGAAAS